MSYVSKEKELNIHDTITSEFKEHVILSRWDVHHSSHCIADFIKKHLYHIHNDPNPRLEPGLHNPQCNMVTIRTVRGVS